MDRCYNKSYKKKNKIKYSTNSEIEEFNESLKISNTAEGVECKIAFIQYISI